MRFTALSRRSSRPSRKPRRPGSFTTTRCASIGFDHHAGGPGNTMTSFRLLTPDAQYADDGVIERRTAGSDAEWDIRRARGIAELPAESLSACDAVVVWHEMKIDQAFVAALKR